MPVYKVPTLYVICNFALASFITLGGLVAGFAGVIRDTAPWGQIVARLFLVAWLCLMVHIWYG